MAVMTEGQIKKGARITGNDRSQLANELVSEYKSGASIRALAEKTGRSYGFIHRILTESGAQLRSRGGATRGGKDKMMSSQNKATDSAS